MSGVGPGKYNRRRAVGHANRSLWVGTVTQKKRELEFLVQVLRALNRGYDLARLAQTILEHAVSLVPQAQTGCFLVLNDEQGAFEYQAAVGWDLERLAQIKIPKECILQRKLGHVGPAIVRDPGGLIRELLPPEIADRLDEFPVAAFISFPISHEGEVIAYFNLDNREDPSAFSPADFDRLEGVWEEITFAVRAARERKRLSESELLFRLLFERLADAVYITAFDGTILAANPAAAAQSGYSPEELVGMNIMRDLAAEEPELTYARVNDLLAHGEVTCFEERKRRKDGSLYWTECMVTLFEHRGERATLSVNRDITDRKAFLDALQESEARYRELFAESPVSLWEEDFSDVKRYLDDLRGQGVRDLRGHLAEHPAAVGECVGKLRVRYVNKATLGLYRAETTEALLGNLERAITPEVHELFKEQLLAIWEGRTEFTGEGVNYSLAGERLHIFLRWAVLPGYEQTLERVLVSILDITARKEAEEALRVSEAEKALILGSVSEHIVFHDSDMRVRWANPAATRAARRTLPEVVGRHCYEIWHGRTAPCPGCPMVEVLTTSRAAAGEMTRPDGRIWFIHGYPALDEAGGVSGAVEVAQEITERKHLEEQARVQAEKLAALHEAVQRLARSATVDEACHAAVAEAARILGLALCGIDLVEGKLLVPKGISKPARELSKPAPYGEGVGWKSILEGRSYWGRLEDFAAARPTRSDFRSFISVPIGDFGVFQAVSTAPDAFTERDVMLTEILAGHVREVIRHLRLAAELREQAIRDPLTGLYNRRFLVETLEREIERAKRYGHPLTLIMADIDEFKAVNDRYGHLVGDAVLRRVAEALQGNVRDSDYVFRYGGEEFVIVLPETGRGADEAVTRLRRAVAGISVEALRGPKVSVSMGYTVCEPVQETPATIEDLLRRADNVLYAMKRRRTGEG